MFAGLSSPLPLLTGAALLGLGAVSFAAVTTGAPAFNEALQIETVNGSGRVANARAMYDTAAYLYEAGAGFLDHEAAGDPPPDSAEMQTEALARAQAHLRESLRRDPANALAWLAYGEALVASGEAAAAAEALQAAQALAPVLTPLAARRIDLVLALRDLTGDDAAFVDLARADLAVLERRDPEAAARAAARLGVSLSSSPASPPDGEG